MKAGAKIVSEYSFIRRRTNKDNLRSHGQTTVITYSTGEQVEIKRIITAREYENAMRRRDPRRHVVKQSRCSFLIEGGSFTVHKYVSPRPGLGVLHSQGKCEVPGWMGVVRELRGEEVRGYGRGAQNLSFIIFLIRASLRATVGREGVWGLWNQFEGGRERGRHGGEGKSSGEGGWRKKDV